MIQFLRASVSLSSSGLKDLCCTLEKKQHQDSPQVEPIRQGPWGRNEPKKTSGLFDYKAASIKWIRVKYQQNPPGLGLLEVKYVEADGQEVKQTYCGDVIGTTYEEVNISAPTSNSISIFIRFCCCVHFLYMLCRYLMVAVCMISD